MISLSPLLQYWGVTLARTERLVLRRFQSLDAKDLADLTSNPDTLHYLYWSAMSLEEAEEWIAAQSGIAELAAP